MNSTKVFKRGGRNNKRMWLFIAFLSVQRMVAAQDPLFSQFYYSPVYLNPAFTGTSKNDFRASFSSRLQWMNLPSPFQYYSLAAEKYFKSPNASLGLMVNRFNEGYIKTNQAYLLGAKSFGANEDNESKLFVNFAFQLGWTWRNADRSKLLFPDQLDANGPTGQASQFELFNFSNKPHLDISSGIVATYSNVMAGIASGHMTKPLIGLLDIGESSRLPRRFTFHLSYFNSKNITNSDKIIVKPTILYITQGESNSMVIGSLFDFPDGVLGAGIWYRNNFGSGKNLGTSENHSISIGITLKLGKVKNPYDAEAGEVIRTGVSYEGELASPGVKHTKGSTELGMLYEKNLRNDNSCPKSFNDDKARYPWVFFKQSQWERGLIEPEILPISFPLHQPPFAIVEIPPYAAMTKTLGHLRFNKNAVDFAGA